jgi:hypothetical protein
MKMNHVVVETREKTYPIFRASRARRGPSEPEHVANITGFEIVKELRVCSNCASELGEKGSTQQAEVLTAKQTAEAAELLAT